MSLTTDNPLNLLSPDLTETLVSMGFQRSGGALSTDFSLFKGALCFSFEKVNKRWYLQVYVNGEKVFYNGVPKSDLTAKIMCLETIAFSLMYLYPEIGDLDNIALLDGHGQFFLSTLIKGLKVNNTPTSESQNVQTSS